MLVVAEGAAEISKNLRNPLNDRAGSTHPACTLQQSNRLLPNWRLGAK